MALDMAMGPGWMAMALDAGGAVWASLAKMDAAMAMVWMAALVVTVLARPWPPEASAMVSPAMAMVGDKVMAIDPND